MAKRTRRVISSSGTNEAPAQPDASPRLAETQRDSTTGGATKAETAPGTWGADFGSSFGGAS